MEHNRARERIIPETSEGMKSSMTKKVVYTKKAPEPVGPYSQAIAAGGLVFVSGQLGMPPGGALGGTVEEQARLSLENVSHILEAAGSSMKNVLKVTILLGDMGDFAAVNRVYSEFFSEPYPARAAFQAAALPLNAMVEIEAVASLKES